MTQQQAIEIWKHQDKHDKQQVTHALMLLVKDSLQNTVNLINSMIEVNETEYTNPIDYPDNVA